MQPQTVSEAIIQHYVNSPKRISSEFKPRKKSGFLLSDLDETVEQEGTPTYVDIIFEGIGDINPYFGEKLPVVRKNIGLMYQSGRIRGPMDDVSRDFRISGVTRGQIKKVTESGLEKYQLNVGLKDFARVDLPNLGIGYILNTGNLDYPVEKLVRHHDINIDRMYYSRIAYSNETDDGIVVEIIPNVLWNKQFANELVADNFGLPHQALITIAESPKYEQYLPMISGLAIWVDPEAAKFPVPSRVNLYMPKAKRNMRELTPPLGHWEIALENHLLETQDFQEKVVATIEEIKKNESDLEADDIAKAARASIRIADESQKLLERARRHSPYIAVRMERCIYIINADAGIETRKSYARKLITEIGSSFAEYHGIEGLRKEIDRIKTAEVA